MIEYLFHQYTDYPTFEIYLEITAVIFGLLSVWYAKKDNANSKPLRAAQNH